MLNVNFLFIVLIQFASQTFSIGFGAKDYMIRRNRKNIDIRLSENYNAFQAPAFYNIPVVIKKYAFSKPYTDIHIIKYHYSEVVKNIDLSISSPVPYSVKDIKAYRYKGQGIRIQYPAYVADTRPDDNGTYTVSVIIFPFKYTKDTKTLYVLDTLEFSLESVNANVHKKHSKSDSPPLYLIVARNSTLSGFSSLALWKRKKGYRVKMLSMEEIDSSFSGRDPAEKLRNALKVYYNDSNLVYVLLGGDVDAVPARVAYAMTCNAGFRDDEDSIRADLYYSDLDGTWDYNNNGVFGEVTDSVDLYPDVYVGRVPADNASQAQNFSQKLINYEKNPDDKVTNALFFAMILWEDPYTNSGESKDYIDSLLIPNYYNTTKFYEANGNETYANVMSALQSGNGLMNHNGHGWWTGMWLNESPNWEYLDTLDADTVHMSFSGIIYSIGCWVGAFDRSDAIAEHFILNPYGPVAFIANSRYGWGSPGNPLYGYSDKLDQNFYRKIFKDSIFHIGITLAENKADFVPLSRWENVYRWHQYEVNLFGDPEMEIHTQFLGEALTDIPDSIATGDNLAFVAYDTHGNLLKDAKLSFSYGDSVYTTTSTSANGAGIVYVPECYMDSLLLTVYARNHRTTERWVYIKRGLSAVKMELNGIDGTKYPFPQDSGSILLYIKNSGTITARNVNVSLSGYNITPLEDSLIVSEILPDSVYVLSVRFRIPGSVRVNDTLTLTAKVNGNTRKFVKILKKPHVGLNFADMESIQTPSDTLHIYLKNTYSEVLHNINIHTWCVQGNVIINNDSSYIPLISPSDSIMLNIPIDIPDTTDTFELGFRVFNNTFLADTFFVNFSVNKKYVHFDFENPLDGFYTTGNWKRVTQRAHSGTYSLWDGNNGHYENNANDTLITPWIHTGYSPTLSFYMWYDATTYGSDGIHILYLKNGEWTELDYIGSGGALDDEKDIITEWSLYTYALSGLSYGDSTKIMLILTTDSSDTAEGFYIDDITVRSSLYSDVNIQPNYSQPVSMPTMAAHLLPVTFALDSPTDVYMLDIQGRQVFYTHAIESMGKLLIRLDKFKPGLYFVNIKTKKTNIVKKVVIER